MCLNAKEAVPEVYPEHGVSSLSNRELSFDHWSTIALAALVDAAFAAKIPTTVVHGKIGAYRESNSGIYGSSPSLPHKLTPWISAHAS